MAVINGNANANVLLGTNLNDLISGFGGNDALFGLNGNDRLFGGSGDDVLIGGRGDDRLNGGNGADVMLGGLGNDTYRVDSFGDVVIEDLGEGIDTVESSLFTYTLGDNVNNLDLVGLARRGNGNDLANVIDGNGLSNILRGFGGNDTINGGFGNDRLEGGTGNDTLNGQFGNDTLLGGSGADNLNGGAGRDSLTGGVGGGVDTFTFSNAPTAGNVDRIEDFSAPFDQIAFENAVFTGLGAAGPLAATAFRAGGFALDATDRVLYQQSTGNLFYDSDGIGGAGRQLVAQLDPGTAVTASDFIVI